MSSGEEYRTRVSNKDGVDTVGKEIVVERGIAKLKFVALLRKRTEKTYKSDQKCEAVLLNQDLSDSSTIDTSFPSEIVCSKVRFEKVSSEDENEDKYDDEFRDEEVTDGKMNGTAVTCDETFEFSYQKFIAGREVALIGEATTPEPELAGEGAALENVLPLSMERLVASVEDQKSHDSGNIAFPEDEKESTSIRHVAKELASKELDEVFDDQKTHDSGIIAFPEDEKESTSLTHVSTELAGKELDGEEAVESDSDSKNQLATTTTMNPKRDAEENINAEPTFTKMGMIDAPSLTDAVENMEHFASMLPNCQVTYDHSITTLSEGVHHVFGIDGHGSEQDGDGIYEREPKQDNDPHEFCVDAKVELEMMGMIGVIASTFANFPCDESSCGSSNAASSDDNENGSTFDGSFTWNNSVVDFPFDEISIESTHDLDRNAALAEDNEDNSIFDGLDRNAALAEDNEDNSIFDGLIWSGSMNGSVNKNDSLNGDDDNASLNENGNDSLNGNDDNSKLHCDGSVSDNNSSINEKVPASDDDHLLQAIANFERQNFDLLELKSVASKREFGLLKRFKKMKNAAKKKSGKKGVVKKLPNETKLVAEDTNGKRMEPGATPEPLRQRKETKDVAEPFRRNKSDADAEPFRDQEGYGDSSTMLENTLLPKENDPSSLGHYVTDCESALSLVEEDGTVVDTYAYDDDSFRNANAPISASSTEVVYETDDEAETSKLVDFVQVAGDSIKILETNSVLKANVDRNTDSIKILATKPLWKTAVDSNTGRTYYYHLLTRETTWAMPANFINQ